MALDIGTGATFTFGTAAIALTFTSIEGSGISREAIDLSHLGSTGGRTFVPGDLYDPGELTFEGLLDASLGDSLITKVSAAAETCTIDFPGGESFAATGFLTELEFGVPLEEEMTFSMTLKLSGDITWADT